MAGFYKDSIITTVELRACKMNGWAELFQLFVYIELFYEIYPSFYIIMLTF